HTVGTRDVPRVSFRGPAIRFPGICLGRPATQHRRNAPSATSVTNSPSERAVRTDPVVDLIRSKLVEPSLRSTADPADVAALQAFYSSRAAPLWITDMGLSTRAQSALFEIERANDWGLDAAAFELPPWSALPASLD